jgi:hypothetical protein
MKKIPLKLYLTTLAGIGSVLTTLFCMRSYATSKNSYFFLVFLSPMLILVAILSEVGHSLDSPKLGFEDRHHAIMSQVALSVLVIAILLFILWIMWLRPRMGASPEWR